MCNEDRIPYSIFLFLLVLGIGSDRSRACEVLDVVPDDESLGSNVDPCKINGCDRDRMHFTPSLSCQSFTPLSCLISLRFTFVFASCSAVAKDGRQLVADVSVEAKLQPSEYAR